MAPYLHGASGEASGTHNQRSPGGACGLRALPGLQAACRMRSDRGSPHQLLYVVLRICSPGDSM